MTNQRRGGHVLDAVIRVVGDRGMEPPGLRVVAAEAGVSLAQVQYYFRNKDELIAAAFEQVSEDFEQSLAALDRSGTRRAVLGRALREWFPLDERRAAATRVWLAFTARAAISAELRATAHRTDQQLRELLTEVLREARDAGALVSGLTPEHEAITLMALIDGLVVQALNAEESEREQFAVVLDAHLDRLLPE